MNIITTPFKDLLIIEPTVFKDGRGYFFETYRKKKLDEFIKIDFVQDNESCSEKNVLRGLHLQLPHFAQAKLIRVINGAILDVAVDLRKNSKTFGKHFKIELNQDNKKQLFIPIGFAHSFITLTDNTVINYKCSEFYSPKSEVSLLWNDKTLNIDWPTKNPIVSDRDKKGQLFESFDSPF